MGRSSATGTSAEFAGGQTPEDRPGRFRIHFPEISLVAPGGIGQAGIVVTAPARAWSGPCPGRQIFAAKSRKAGKYHPWRRMENQKGLKTAPGSGIGMQTGLPGGGPGEMGAVIPRFGVRHGLARQRGLPGSLMFWKWELPRDRFVGVVGGRSQWAHVQGRRPQNRRRAAAGDPLPGIGQDLRPGGQGAGGRPVQFGLAQSFAGWLET